MFYTSVAAIFDAQVKCFFVLLFLLGRNNDNGIPSQIVVLGAGVMASTLSLL